MNNVAQAIKDMVQGVLPILPLIMGIVQWCKVAFRIKSESVLNILAMAFGLLGGTGYMLAVQMPDNYTGWFLVVVYGITLGLGASGIFKVGAQMADKSAALSKVATTTTTTETTVEAKPSSAVVMREANP